mgnify:CR=1 FL=1|jgi:hypothetical protein
MNDTKDLIDQKWDAIDSASKTINEVRSDLFDHVALALSRIEGRMSFLNGENFDGKPFLEGHAQKVGFELEAEVNQTRKELDKIFVKLTEGRDNLLG